MRFKTAFVIFSGFFVAAHTEARTAAAIIPFDASRWEFTGSVQPEKHLGQNALKIGAKDPGKPFGMGAAMLKGLNFRKGVIEYDVAFAETPTFAGLRFRAQPGKNTENFFMRAHNSGNLDANQYMPVYNGMQSWQLYHGKPYSAPVKYAFNEWMHVKLVVAESLADIYIKDMSKPALTVQLKRKGGSGKVGLWAHNLDGAAWFANFSAQEIENPEIKGKPEQEPPARPGTVMSWLVSGAFDGNSLAGKTLLNMADSKGLEFKSLQAESTGITNLAELQGAEKGKDTVFAKIVIDSAAEHTKKMQFGFSNKVKVYLNGQLLFEADDSYSSRDYRFLGTMGWYDALCLPLKKGTNEVLLTVTAETQKANGGWAVQARLENTEGIKF